MIDSHRKFQLWRATASHSQILLRSNKTDDHPTRVEVLFKSVYAAKLLTTIEGLEVLEANRAMAAKAIKECGLAKLDAGLRVFSVADGRHFEGWVIGGSVTTREDDGEYDEPSGLL